MVGQCLRGLVVAGLIAGMGLLLTGCPEPQPSGTSSSFSLYSNLNPGSAGTGTTISFTINF